ncbi:MAG: bifunctional riboflavin kinase/FAD synthetase [Geothrix sp.]|uniref:Riboflavin biosynthesis protein n=1 Tax=Candidatus Geothrix odensensis TaxID=2954440 RepID=A0A936F3F6_9BACT|nr:bifunctional riboflavin kinase/FAD synthetase [Candidatus Geothrix odensensis]MBP7617023.1 bifunctional riboflavin kinase/FAD synthetase [Geothrix sp.]
MEVWRHELESAPASGPFVVTLGTFDGVHAGHRELLQIAAARARLLSRRAAVVTFDPHPTLVVAPQRKPKLLMTLEQRLAAFEAAGMDTAWVIPFSRTFSELSPEAFLDRIQQVLAPVEIHVGRAFQFGRDRSGTVETLAAWGAAHGCEVRTLALRAPDGGRLSSTRIREALDAGEAEVAAALLGHPYALTGVVVEGDRRGRHLGFPTANLAWEQEQLPAFGVYVTKVLLPHQGGVRLGLTNVGEKPTFEGRRLTVETHLPGFDGDLYGTRLTVGFLHRIRGEVKFASVDELRVQIAQDVAEGKVWWKAHQD